LCHAISFHLSPLYRGKGTCANAPDVRGFKQSTSQLTTQEDCGKKALYEEHGFSLAKLASAHEG
jgi:hypothetical protein